MHKVFSTELNPEISPEKPRKRLSTLQSTFNTNKQEINQYINSLDIKVNDSMLKQISQLRMKHLELGGVLSGLKTEKTRIQKEALKRQEDYKECFQNYLMKDIEKFKDHKDFFRKYFSKFSAELNQAMEKRNKLLICVAELRKQLKEIKREQIRRMGESIVLPALNSLRTSKTIRTTEPTERSIRLSTDTYDPSLITNPMSPNLMRMGGSQPVLGSRIHQPIKTVSTSNKKQQRKKSIQLLKSMFQQRFRQKSQGLKTNFQKMLFQRRNYSILMQFFDGLEFN